MCWACARGTATRETSLDQEQVQAARREDVLNALSQDRAQIQNPGGRIAGDGGKALDAARRGDDTVTRSLEGVQHRHEGGLIAPGMTAGHALFPARRRDRSQIRDGATRVWGLSYSTVGESVLSAESTTRAWQLRDRVSDRERFFIDFTYDRQVTGNLEKAYQTLELWLQTYPRGEQPNAQGLLGGLSTHGTGRFERAIEASQREIAARSRLCASGMAVLRRAISSSTASPKPRARFNEPPNASWRSRFSGDPIQHRGLDRVTRSRWIE